MSGKFIHEVNFVGYCPKCEFKENKGHMEPCNECLETPGRSGTMKPLKFKEKVGNDSKKTGHVPQKTGQM